ncbi:MAG: hypothetical protein AAGK02_14070 [Pseudomonadota bacterium]
MKIQKHESTWVLFSDLFASLAIIFLLISIGLVPMTNGGGSNASTHVCAKHLVEFEQSISAKLAELKKDDPSGPASTFQVQPVGTVLEMPSGITFDVDEHTLGSSERKSVEVFCGVLQDTVSLPRANHNLYMSGSTSSEHCTSLRPDEKQLIQKKHPYFSEGNRLVTVEGDISIELVEEWRLRMFTKNKNLAVKRAEYVDQICRGEIQNFYLQAIDVPLPTDHTIWQCASIGKAGAEAERTVKFVIDAKNC